MTDLLAPLLAAFDDEPEAFWCFTELVQSSAFYKPGKDHISISHQIVSLTNIFIKCIISQKLANYYQKVIDYLSIPSERPMRVLRVFF